MQDLDHSNFILCSELALLSASMNKTYYTLQKQSKVSQFQFSLVPRPSTFCHPTTQLWIFADKVQLCNIWCNQSINQSVNQCQSINRT